jgi:hypothetical protein
MLFNAEATGQYKSDYKGSCRLDYFLAYVLNDVLKGIEVPAGR